MTYFTIPINAKSEKERAERIKDNEANGFELVKTFERISEGNVWVNSGYRDEGGIRLRYAGSHSHVNYCAVMRRDNSEYLKRKKMAQ